MTKQRIEELDLMKFVVICLVVIGHSNCPDGLNRYISMIHMPVFFMISGFTDKLSADLDWTKFWHYCLGKIKRLYVPFIISAIALTSLHNCFFQMGLYPSAYAISDYIIQFAKEIVGGLGLNDPVITHLWFLRVLLVAMLLRAFLFCVFRNRYVDISLMIIGLCALLVSEESFGSSFFGTQMIWPLRALFYIVLGKYLFVYYRQRLVIIVSSLLFLVYVMVTPYCPLIHYFHSASGLFSLISVLSSLGFFVSSFYLLRWILNHHRCSILLKMGRNTMPVYILHFPILSLLPVIYDSFGYGQGAGTWALSVVLSFIFSLVIGVLWSRVSV